MTVIVQLLERITLHRITPKVEELLSEDEAGFRQGRSTCVQVTALTTYIENGFQRNMKTGAVFLDLTAAYDTIWHTGLLAKLAGNLPSWFVRVTAAQKLAFPCAHGRQDERLAYTEERPATKLSPCTHAVHCTQSRCVADLPMQMISAAQCRPRHSPNWNVSSQLTLPALQINIYSKYIFIVHNVSQWPNPRQCPVKWYCHGTIKWYQMVQGTANSGV